MPEQCPICKSSAQQIDKASSREYWTECERCGVYKYSQGVHQIIGPQDVSKKMAISHWIRSQNDKGYKPDFYDSIYTKDFFDSLSLPNPAEQADSLIFYLGKNSKSASQDHKLTKQDVLRISAIVGCVNNEDLIFVFEHLKEIGLIAYRFLGGVGVSNGYSTMVTERSYNIKLTFVGWQKYEELKIDHSESKQVFMAMAYSNSELREIFENFLLKWFKDDLGLDLVRLIDKPKDGIIDNHLRVEIRKSCLLISDLTDNNSGAYWEAGYAEGLGKPVIYFCKKKKFDAESTHFDTSHLQTVTWEKETIEQDYKKLKDLIRVILPDKAKMEDGEEKNEL